MHRFLPYVLPLLASCYSYATIEPTTVRPGTSVRARVSSAAADRLAPLIGSSNARVLTGSVVGAMGDTTIVEVPTTAYEMVGNSLQPLHQRVSIARSELLELETRRLDRGRTAALAGSAALLVGTVVIKALRNDRGKEQSPGGGGPGELRAPLLRLHW